MTRHKTRIRLLALLAGLCSLTAVQAQSTFDSASIARTGWFKHAPYGKSLLSDVHPNFIRFETVVNTNHPLYDFARTGKEYRAGVQGCFGVDLPLWSGDFGPDNRYGVCISQTASAYLWMDLFEPHTSPVINTDYRVGSATHTFIHRLNRKFVKNYAITWTPFKHESTHIGDEIQIQRMEEGYALRRVNVSYNYTELAVTLNEPEDRSAQCHTFRLGLMLLWSPKDGWYKVYEAAGDGDASLVHPRMSPWEAYFQYQYQTPTSPYGFQGVVSAEIRNRAVYGYDLTLKPGQPDHSPADYRRFTYSVFAGARYNIPGYDGIFSRFALGIRLYHGNCPFGQYRSIDNYSQAGISLIWQ